MKQISPTEGERYAGNISWLERARHDKSGAAVTARHVVDPRFDQDSYTLADFVGLSFRLQAEEARG